MNKFTSLQQVKEYLKEQLEQLRIDEQVVDNQIRLGSKLLANGPTYTVEDVGGGKTKLKRTINIDFPDVEIPNKEKLAEKYKILEEQTQRYKALLDTQNEIRLQFKNSSGPLFNELMGSFQKIKTATEEVLKKLFEFLNQVAEGHAPKEYKKFVVALAKELETHLQFDSMKTMTYAAVDDKGALVFAGYIIIQNATNDEQKQVPNLYVVIKWTVGGNVEIFCEHEFVAPNLLEGGSLVKDLRSAAQAVKQELTLEGFSSAIGNLPLSMQMKRGSEELKEIFLTANEFVSKVEVSEDALIFVLKPGINSKEMKEVQYQLYEHVRAMLKNRRGAKVSMHPTGNLIKFTITNLDAKYGVMPHDIEWLKDKYELTESQLRKIANVLNGK